MRNNKKLSERESAEIRWLIDRLLDEGTRGLYRDGSDTQIDFWVDDLEAFNGVMIDIFNWRQSVRVNDRISHDEVEG